jgi:hypothetical protein
MTGLEHYAEAERLLVTNEAEAVARAQVHATLAAVWAHNRTTTELSNLLNTFLDQIREAREAQA